MMCGCNCDRVERPFSESADARQIGGFASQRESCIGGTRLFVFCKIGK